MDTTWSPIRVLERATFRTNERERERVGGHPSLTARDVAAFLLSVRTRTGTFSDLPQRHSLPCYNPTTHSLFCFLLSLHSFSLLSPSIALYRPSSSVGQVFVTLLRALLNPRHGEQGGKENHQTELETYERTERLRGNAGQALCALGGTPGERKQEQEGQKQRGATGERIEERGRVSNTLAERCCSCNCWQELS